MQGLTQGFIFDIEADNFFLESTNIWIIDIKDIRTNEHFKIYPFRDGVSDSVEQFMKIISKYERPIIAGHYIVGYDLLMLMKHLGMNINIGSNLTGVVERSKDFINGKEVCFIDTFCLSQFLAPDRAGGHSLDNFGKLYGMNKLEFDKFHTYSKEMDVYCERDVDLNHIVFNNLLQEFMEMYNHKDLKSEISFVVSQKTTFLMACQELTGWKFDIEEAKKLQKQIVEDMSSIEADVEPSLPPRKLKKTEEKEYTMPMKPYKKDGSFSSHMNNFIERHCLVVDGDNTVIFNGKKIKVFSNNMLEATKPMTLSDQNAMKEWFLEQGWVPTMFNYKKDSFGKLERGVDGKLIKTSSKIQESGKICPNLFKLQGDLPSKITKWLSLRNRLGIINSWLSNTRLDIDGRLPTRSTGITPTHRQKHACVVNVPKAEEGVLYGKEFRSLFCCEEGKILSSADASALEGRVEGSYTFKYDGGERADIILNGDIHSKNAKVFFKKETKDFDIEAEDFDKDSLLFKPFRSKAKNGAYCLAYGGSASKLAETLGKPQNEAEELYDAFWDNNPSLKALRDAITKYWKRAGKRKRLPAIDGRWLVTRKENALVNFVFQSCGAIAMDYSGVILDEWFGGIVLDKNKKPCYILENGEEVRRVGYFHDEYTFEQSEELKDFVGQKIVDSIILSGEMLKLNVPLAAKYSCGDNWKEIH